MLGHTLRTVARHVPAAVALHAPLPSSQLPARTGADFRRLGRFAQQRRRFAGACSCTHTAPSAAAGVDMASSGASSTGAGSTGAGAGVGAGAGASASAQPFLVIHLDANETVLFRDDAGGKSMLAVVSEIIAESAWGVIGPPAEDGGALTWALAGDEVTDSPPPALSDATVGTDVGCACTYADFVKDVLFPRVPMAELEGGELKRALGENETRKRARVDHFERFVTAGAPGERLKRHLKAAIQGLTIPEHMRPACKRALHELAGGYRFVCPSYFALLQHLDATRSDFATTFRTFGSDSAMLVAEHNMFCEGRHPLYPGVRMDGTCGSVDRRIKLPRDSGRFYRADGLIQLSTVNEAGLVDYVTGWKGVFHEMKRKLQGTEGRAMCIQDYYPYWHRKDRATSASKAMPIDSSDPSVHHIFFDDNIADTFARIVDVYDVASGEHLPFQRTNGVYIVRARQLDNLRDEQYFVKRVQECEAARAAQFAAASAASK